jgi:predicted metal-binding membrane protein
VLATRDRATLVTYGVLLVVSAAAWMSMLRSPMGGDDMAGIAMAMTPTVAEGVAFVVPWAIMMAAMMLPSATPMIGFYAAMQPRDGATAMARIVAVASFALTYVALWALTGVPIYLASVALMGVGPAILAYTIAAALVVAGLFQFSRFKGVCLRHCRSPLGFLVGHWRAGWRGGVAMGWAHALYCLGCCWALMLVLVVAGAMGLPWVLLIACVVAAEKILPRGEWIARTSGVALALLGVAVAIQPGLATALRASSM